MGAERKPLSSTSVNHTYGTKLPLTQPRFDTTAVDDSSSLLSSAAASKHPGEEGASRKANVSPGALKFGLVLLVFAQFAVNIDSGFMAVFLSVPEGTVTERYSLDSESAGMLMSGVFLGHAIGCLVSGGLIRILPPKALLTTALLLYAGTSVAFCFCGGHLWFLLASRVASGLCGSLVIVSAPLWVHTNAEITKVSAWMALVQAAVPVGVLGGYVAASLTAEHAPHMWEWAFYSQAMVLGLCAFGALVAPRNALTLTNLDDLDEDDEANPSPLMLSRAPSLLHYHASGMHSGRTSPRYQAFHDDRSTTAADVEYSAAINTHEEYDRDYADAEEPAIMTAEEEQRIMENGGAGTRASSPAPRCDSAAVRYSNVQTPRPIPEDDAKPLRCNGVFIAATVTLCALYFVVTGLQLWVTSYLRKPPISASLTEIMVAYGSASATAPVLGVLAGGKLVGCVNGHEVHQSHRAAVVAAASGGIAAGAAAIAAFASDIVVFAIGMWLLIFAGAIVVPVATSLLLGAVSEEQQPLAAGYSACAYNFFGFFLAPMACGYAAKFIGLQWAFRAVLGVSGLAFLGTLVVAILCYRRTRGMNLKPLHRLRRSASTARPGYTRANSTLSHSTTGTRQSSVFAASLPRSSLFIASRRVVASDVESRAASVKFTGAGSASGAPSPARPRVRPMMGVVGHTAAAIVTTTANL